MIRPSTRGRGDILRIVRQFGVDGITQEHIERVFIRAGRISAMNRLEEDLLYLSEKGYLARVLAKDPFSGVERWILHITPKGIDLLDEIIDPDPGVEIVC